MIAMQYAKAFLLRDRCGDRSETLAHEPSVIADDQRVAEILLSFQISANRSRDPFDVCERKIFCDDRPPPRRAKLDLHCVRLFERPNLFCDSFLLSVFTCN